MIALSNTQLVMLGTSLLGAVAGVVGSFAVLRRRALVGDLVSHAALPGLCMAFLALNYRPLAERWWGGSTAHAGSWQFTAMLAGAFATGLLGVALVTLVCRWTRTKEDAAIGIVLSTFFGAGVVLSSLIQNLPTAASKAGLQTYIYGQAAGMTREDVWFITVAAAACLTLIALLYKEFQVFSFDPGFARARMADAHARLDDDGNVGAGDRRGVADGGGGADGGHADRARGRRAILDRSAGPHARGGWHAGRAVGRGRHADLGRPARGFPRL